MSQWEGRPVVRSPKQLRPHPALEEIGWTGVIDEFNDAARLNEQSVADPLLVTTNGTILAGIGHWQSAISNGTHALNCIEYPLSEDESLRFIIRQYQPRRGWNAFIRICLALTLEPNLHQRAVDNMRKGGKCKGSTNLSKPARIEVRREIANAAGTGTGNVDKVKAILRSAHPNIITALQNGSLKIHRAWKWCRLPKSQQKEEFASYEEEQTRHKILREFGDGRSRASFGLRQVLEALQSVGICHPGQIIVRGGTRRETIVILGQDLIEKIKAMEDATRHA
ncbi:MAG TPA: hypothetical protein VK302_08710 [Terriglobales bacterium]|nr:hypothetical protein [Terriglobales bacterium]